MNVSDVWQLVTNPQIWPLFLTFLGGYVMMNALLGREKVTELSELEKILVAFSIGALFTFTIFLPIVLIASFWFPYSGDLSMVASMLLIVASVVVLAYNAIESKKIDFQETTDRVLSLAIIPFILFVASSLAIEVGIQLFYPEHTTYLIAKNWSSFRDLSIVSLGLYSGGTFLFKIYICKSAEFLEAKNIEIMLKKRFIQTFLVAIPIIIIITSLVLIPLDATFGFFTPRIIEGEESFSPQLSFGQDNYRVVFIDAIRGRGGKIDSTYRSYSLLEKKYEIKIPSIRLLSSIYISNPSNTSYLINEYSQSLPNGYEGWERIRVLIPENVTYGSIPKNDLNNEESASAFTIIYDEKMDKSSFFVNFSYWQEVGSTEKIVVNYKDLIFTDLENGSWMETHIIEVLNHSNDTLYIPAVDYDRFNFDYVIRNSTLTYFNDELRPFSQLIRPIRLGFMDVYISPQEMGKITITFLTNRNPE